MSIKQDIRNLQLHVEILDGNVQAWAKGIANLNDAIFGDRRVWRDNTPAVGSKEWAWEQMEQGKCVLDTGTPNLYYRLIDGKAQDFAVSDNRKLFCLWDKGTFYLDDYEKPNPRSFSETHLP